MSSVRYTNVNGIVVLDSVVDPFHFGQDPDPTPYPNPT